MRTILIAALVLTLTACQHSRVTTDGPGSAGPPSSPAATATMTTVEPATTTTTAPSPTTAVPPTTPPAPVDRLQPGNTGPAVTDLQARLAALGYWLGAIDGSYGSSTSHAVTAFQKASGLARDGIAGPATMAALDRAGRPQTASTSGHVIEIDLARQLVIVADDGSATWVFDASTGIVPGTTPVGRFTIFRQVNGQDTGPYGPLYRPKYFHHGVAIHGYPSVPPTPASHGCVRITNAAIDELWNSGTLPLGTTVWVY